MDFSSGYAPVANFLSGVSADWIILGIVVAVCLFDAIRSGSGRIATIGISITIAVPTSSALAKAAYLGALSGQFNTPVLKASLFFALLTALYFFLRRIFIDYGETGGQPIQSLFAAVATTALITLAWIQIDALNSVWNFGPQVKTVFGEAYRFWWLSVSLAALAFAKS